ncbi:MAG: sulfotransferase [Armatimonadetes bacterium]|nr:MAG: sulfotransferase [Armatimonadota bacterium]
MTKYLFIVGTGRCGSSLVHETLARHPDVGFLSNIDDRMGRFNLKGRFNNALYSGIPQRLTRKGRVRFAPSEGYRILARQVSPMLVEPYRDLTDLDDTPWMGDRIRTFFEERRRAQGKQVFLHKFTGWPRARLIHHALDDVRFIHIVRDGRAVASSLIQMPWWSGFAGPDQWRWGPLPGDLRSQWEESGSSWPALAGIEWRILMDAYEATREALPREAWLELRYEDILSDPQASFDKMIEFAELGRSLKFTRALANQTFSTARATSFSSELSAHDLDTLEVLIGSHLRRYGYESP